MDDDKIAGFELIKYFSSYYAKIIRSASKHPDFKSNQNNHHLLSENAKEANRIFDFMGRLNGLTSDLDKIQTFIRRFPLKKYYKSNDIDQLDYVKYHYEVFIHKIHTILEVKKLWMNDFYNIGLKEEDCNWNNLKGYSEIQKSPTKIIIDSYFKSFEYIIKFRHLNTHRAFFKDSKKDDLQAYTTLYDMSKKFGIETDNLETIRPKFIVEYQIKEYKKEKLEYIKNGTEIAKTYSDHFISLILTEFFAKMINKN